MGVRLHRSIFMGMHDFCKTPSIRVHLRTFCKRLWFDVLIRFQWVGL